MLHPRYSNFWHCFYQTFKEEGITKGLYRGYCAYMVAFPLTYIVAPMLAQGLLENSVFYGNTQ